MVQRRAAPARHRIDAIDLAAPILSAIGISFSTFRAADLLIVKSNLGLVDRLDTGAGAGLRPVPAAAGGAGRSPPTTRSPRCWNSRSRSTAARFGAGASQILTGMFKVFVLAYFLSWSGDTFDVFAANDTWRVWAGLTAFTWFFYVNFAGYSDLAIGSARCSERTSARTSTRRT